MPGLKIQLFVHMYYSSNNYIYYMYHVYVYKSMIHVFTNCVLVLFASIFETIQNILNYLNLLFNINIDFNCCKGEFRCLLVQSEESRSSICNNIII